MTRKKYCLNVTALRHAANKLGDATDYAIAKRTGLTKSGVWKLTHHQSLPSRDTLISFHETYGIRLDDLLAECTHTTA